MPPVKQPDMIEKLKAWAFPTLIAVVGYFGVQTINRIDVIVSKLNDINVSVKSLEIQQRAAEKEIDKHDVRINELERDHTTVKPR